MDTTSTQLKISFTRATGNTPLPNGATRLLMAFCIILFAGLISAAYATSFKCTAPTAGGTFTIGVKSLTEKCDPIKVHIPAGITAEQKAEHINELYQKTNQKDTLPAIELITGQYLLFNTKHLLL